MSALLLTLAAALNAPAAAPQMSCAPSGALRAPLPAMPYPLQFRNLGELPDANHIRAVFREMNGCSMLEVTRFHVSSPGGYAPGGVLVPQRNGRIDTGWRP